MMGKKLQDTELIEETASLMRLVFFWAAHIDLEFLKEFREHYRDQISTYEAIGFVEGFSYSNKLSLHRAKLLRLDSLIKLIKTLQETNFDATQDIDESMDISKLFK